jgi:hypothetical protein
VNGLEIAAAGETSATGTEFAAGDAWPVPAAIAVGSSEAGGSAPALVVDDGRTVAAAGVEGFDVRPGGLVATGVGRGVGLGVGRAVGDGVGVVVEHVPAGDTGGGSAPASGSYRKPASSPSLSVAIDTPCGEFAHAPPAREMKNTQ